MKGYKAKRAQGWEDTRAFALLPGCPCTSCAITVLCTMSHLVKLAFSDLIFDLLFGQSMQLPV